MPDSVSTQPAYPWWVLPGLASQVLFVFGGALIASCVLADMRDVRTQMFTGAYGLANLALGYFFGSSASSAKKDDTLAAASAALASSSPGTPVTTTTKTETGAGATTTTTAPTVAPSADKPAGPTP